MEFQENPSIGSRDTTMQSDLIYYSIAIKLRYVSSHAYPAHLSHKSRVKISLEVVRSSGSE